MRLVDDPDERLEYPPAECRGCGADLAPEPVTAQRRHQVTDIAPAPAPKVTEYVAQAKQCPCCGTVTEGGLPPHVRARASYGPEAGAQAANLTVGHHIPVYRATLLLCQLAGIKVSAGWMAGIRGKPTAGRPRAWGGGWDVALSFAGARRHYVEQVAQVLRVRGCAASTTPIRRSSCEGNTWRRNCRASMVSRRRRS